MRNPKHYKQVNYTIRGLQILSALVAMGGFFLFFGAVGAYDHAVMTFGKFITYAAIGLSFAVGGVLSFHWLEGVTESDD